jgi:L-asparaginase II
VRFATIRSGQIESTHEVSVVAVDTDGRTVGSWGDEGTGFFYRSAIKPFQAMASLECGIRFSPEQIAVICSSHGGYPLHRALVAENLSSVGLDENDLQCPAAWPRDPEAKDMLRASGYHMPRRIFHNCSGKHSGWLAACAAQGWATNTYLSADHPVQRRVANLIKEVTGVDAEPTGVDGCGAPTMPGELPGLARAFSILSTDSRFSDIAHAMKRFPAIVSSNTLGEGRFAAWWGGPVKGGAQGLMAAGRNGIGLAAKSHDGNVEIALAGLLEAIRLLGLLSDVAEDALAMVAHIPVLGGGRQVGSIEPVDS